MDPCKMGFRPTSPTRPVTPEWPRSKDSSRLGVWQKLQKLFARDSSLHRTESICDATRPNANVEKPLDKLDTPSTRRVGIGLPRQTTFRRQNSEKRERLCPIEPGPHERRAFSTSRQGSNAVPPLRSKSVPPTALPARCSTSPPRNVSSNNGSGRQDVGTPPSDDQPPANDVPQPIEYDRQRPPRPPSVTSSTDSFDGLRDNVESRDQLNRELDTKWILNLSMHFRDKSDREKFFVTYAETPTRWRRVTISCDYRNAEPGSLEMDLRELQLQRDKSMQIYEAIRDSLQDIKFHDTVTNLKLETSDRRLNVHVTEDVNEIIPYPPTSTLHHILQDARFKPKLIPESDLSFEAHLSGFVYKVKYRNKAYIKKEIPGPDTVDEFLYEVNALHALRDSPYVIDLEAIITDETGQLIKGLLISYAERGAVVDLLYDLQGTIPWEDRERWARQAIQGLSDIHEEGYVQGDFTLSNVVVDADNNAKIIDINRRGCPVGWEPPEIAKKIASNQRIAMYIGEKSDLYQLGMTLWALAMDDDEPERHDPPLSTQRFPEEVPRWYQAIVQDCLSIRPRDRSSATDLLKAFPDQHQPSVWPLSGNRPLVRVRAEKQYIDPATAVERDDLERYRNEVNYSDDFLYSPESSRGDPTFTWPPSSYYDRDNESINSDVDRPRGRRRISDHDSELREQRRREQGSGHANHEARPQDTNIQSAPIISITPDGMQSYLVDGGNDTQPIEIDSSYPDLGTMETPTNLSSDRLLFSGLSEPSDDTPRHSSLQLFDTGLTGSNHSSPISEQEIISFDLAGLGGHPNLSQHSFGYTEPVNDEEMDVDLSTTHAHLSFTDSGFNEPSFFGIDEDSPTRYAQTPPQQTYHRDLCPVRPEHERESHLSEVTETQYQKSSIEGASTPWMEIEDAKVTDHHPSSTDTEQVEPSTSVNVALDVTTSTDRGAESKLEIRSSNSSSVSPLSEVKSVVPEEEGARPSSSEPDSLKAPKTDTESSHYTLGGDVEHNLDKDLKQKDQKETNEGGLR